MTETEYVITSPKAWGKDKFETEALINLANQLRDYPDTVEIEVYRVSGFHSISGFGGLKAEEVRSKEEMTVSGKKLRKLSEMSKEMEILAEEILME